MLLDDIADLLSTGGISGTVYKGWMPDAGTTAVAVYETGGQRSVHAMGAEPGQAVVERPRVQVVTRAAGDDYQTARNAANNAFRLLDGVRERTINGTRYLWICAVQSPFLMGRDANQRVLIAANFDVMKVLSTSTST